MSQLRIKWHNTNRALPTKKVMRRKKSKRWNEMEFDRVDKKEWIMKENEKESSIKRECSRE